MPVQHDIDVDVQYCQDVRPSVLCTLEEVENLELCVSMAIMYLKLFVAMHMSQSCAANLFTRIVKASTAC